MWDTIQKLKYRADVDIPEAKAELTSRLSERVEVPLSGIHGERLCLTGVAMLRKRAAELDVLFEKLPQRRGAKDTIVLDAWSSATIEGARTTVAQVKRSFANPQTKDDRMVVNTIVASNYAYEHPIGQGNIRLLWEKVVEGVCENFAHRGTMYRDGMVYIGTPSRVIHTPAAPEAIPALMEQWFAFQREKTDDLLLHTFVAHFYFVYIHPFCDGNGRMARILNSSQLYHGGYRKVKSLALSNAINNQLSGYYRSLSDSEAVLSDGEGPWLDLSPFVSYMLDVFECCLVDAGLSQNALSLSETLLLERMNKAGVHAEITTKKAARILGLSESSARNALNGLVQKGYLEEDASHPPFRYRLRPHFPTA